MNKLKKFKTKEIKNTAVIKGGTTDHNRRTEAVVLTLDFAPVGA